MRETTDHTATRPGVTMKGRTLALVAGALLLAACSTDKLTVPNRNSPIPGNIDAPTSVNLQVGGILFQERANDLTRVADFQIFGREGFNYFPTDNRWTTGYLVPVTGTQGLNYASDFGRGEGLWNGVYRQRRNIHTLLATVEGAATLSDAQKAGIRGFANTFAALAMLAVIESRDSLGAVVDILDDPTGVAPFVSRDSVYSWISGTLDDAAADLQAAGATPFSFESVLHTGFDGFDTPATFLEVNRAIAARALVYRASLGCATCYQDALTAIGESFLTESAAGMTTGVYHIFSTTSGDATNSLSRDANTDLVAHPSLTAAAELKGDATPDNRYASKVATIAERRPAGPDGTWQTIGIATTLGFTVYPTRTTRMPLVRGEELLLLRAEARWFTGAKALAIADIDWIRTNVGGLAPSTLTTASTDAEFVTELLQQRRFSLLLEGHRWVDHRRLGRLNDLPLDVASHFRAKVQPINAPECDIRVGRGAELAGPGCPNN